MICVRSGDTLAYDANNHMTSALDNVTHNTETYVYDGAGQRIMKGNSGTVHLFSHFPRANSHAAHFFPDGPFGEGQAPLNPSGNSPVPGAAANGASYIANVLQCIANINNY